MNVLQFAPEAEQDLNDIYDYIDQYSARIAARVVNMIETACRILANFPGIGNSEDVLRPGLRSFSTGKYVIFLQARQSITEIVRIVRGAREITSLFTMS